MQVDTHSNDFIFQELYLTRPESGYQLQVRGKNGEPRPQEEVEIEFILKTRAEGFRRITK